MPDGSQYTDVPEPRGSEYANLVHLDRSEYTEIRDLAGPDPYCGYFA